MKILLILRHAKSSLRGPNSLDHERPLDELARYDARTNRKGIRTEATNPTGPTELSVQVLEKILKLILRPSLTRKASKLSELSFIPKIMKSTFYLIP